jgi:glutathione peroxidase
LHRGVEAGQGSSCLIAGPPEDLIAGPPEDRYGAVMSLYDIPISALDGSTLDLTQLKGKATLVVNVASKCGLTPQYEGLEKLQERYSERGLTVLGVPCNQFGGQEPGSADEISTFCSTTYGVTFPLTEKVEVNGDNRHPLYQQLTVTPDAEGNAGDIQWNFEKFLVSPEGEVVGRFRPLVTPEADELVSAIEAVLAS